MKEFTRENEVFETIAVLLIALKTGYSYRQSNPYHLRCPKIESSWMLEGLEQSSIEVTCT